MVFTDILGYTGFSERVSPEVVIEALNGYFRVRAAVMETHNGDVDTFIGNALVAVFEGEDMEQRVIACSVAVTGAMVGLLKEFPD